MSKTNAWGALVLLAFFFGLSPAFAGDKEWTDPDGEWKVENRLESLHSDTQVSTGVNGVVVPPVRLDVLEVKTQILDWDAIRKQRFEAAANSILGKINFDFDKDILDEEARTTVSELAALLQANQDMGLKLAGHTDLMGSDAYNMDLSFRRAEKVRLALIELGVDGARLQASHFGKRQPLINIVRKERINRRVQAEAFDLLHK